MDSDITGSTPPTVRSNRSAYAIVAGWLGRLLPLPIVAAIVVQAMQIRDLQRKLDYREWRDLQDHGTWMGSQVRPETNVIQFINKGYSIQFETVAYEPAGLRLVGFFGNPTNLWIHSLSITIAARRPALYDEYRVADEFEKILWTAPEIGNAQTTPIALLPPGQRGRFEITIPNVRQTSERVELWVTLSGERYSYSN